MRVLRRGAKGRTRRREREKEWMSDIEEDIVLVRDKRRNAFSRRYRVVSLSLLPASTMIDMCRVS